MIEFINLSYRVNGKRILSGITASAKDGEITVILGKNGSGKTTLVRAISAPCEHRRYIEGEILVSGENALALSPRALSSRISLLPQLLPTVMTTVTDLVSLAMMTDRSPFSRLGEDQKRRVRTAIDTVGLSHLADSPIARLSGGERQLAYIAMMMAKGAENLILDEPTSALDPVNRGAVLEFLRRMREEGRAVIVVLQDMNDAIAIADRVIVIDKGGVTFDGTPQQLESSDIPSRHFGLVPCRVEKDGESFTAYFPKK